MTERSDIPDEAKFSPSHWPGLIWALPIAALGIVLWLALSAILRSGPEVTVVFPLAGGLNPQATKVEYHGVTVGHVSSVTIAKSLDHMTVDIDFISTMAGHLGPGTQFWITGHSLSFTDLASLKAMVSGPFIGIDPRPGKIVHHFVGLATPPVLKSEPQGETLTLVADRLSNISPGSPVFFKGYQVGEIRGLTMQPHGGHFDIYAFIPKEYENLVNRHSRFWNAGAVHIAMEPSGPSVQIQSVPALVTGAVAFETPTDGGAAQAVGNGNSFILYPSRAAARTAPGPDAVPYRVVLSGGPHGLAAGAAVELEGAPAGAVTSVAVEYDEARGALSTVVNLVLQPQRIGRTGRPWNMTDPAPQMSAMLASLINQGLRAELASAVPVVGGKIIELAMVKGQPPEGLGAGSPPEIPSINGGAGVGQIMAQVNDILATMNAMPLDQIADNIHQATAALVKLSTSPQTENALRRLDRSITHVEDMTRQADARLPAILTEVRRSATDADSALGSAQALLSSQGAANSGTESADLPEALYELTRAARSLRELTGYLDSHPNALLLGKGD